MTQGLPPLNDASTLGKVLDETDALLLDFDGPICSVFANKPAHAIANRLRETLANEEKTQLPTKIAMSKDPFDILRYAATLGKNEERYIEIALRAEEIEAIQTAEPTPGAHELMRKWRSTGRNLAIVSNNSMASIETYLEKYELTNEVQVVAARYEASSKILKPNPDLIEMAAANLNVNRSHCTLIGDSESDIIAANRAQIKSIAYANRKEKIAFLMNARASCVVTTIEAVLTAVELLK